MLSQECRGTYHLCDAIYLSPDDDGLDLALGAAQRLDQGAHLQSRRKDDGDLCMANNVLHCIWPQGVQQHAVRCLPVARLQPAQSVIHQQSAMGRESPKLQYASMSLDTKSPNEGPCQPVLQ